MNTNHDLQPPPDTLRWRSSTVVKAPMRLTKYEQNIMYGVKCIVGLVPIGYFALISELMTTFEAVHESSRELPLFAEANLRAPSKGRPFMR
jgi:hypothetical protein